MYATLRPQPNRAGSPIGLVTMLKHFYVALVTNRAFRLFFIFGGILLCTLCLVYILSLIEDIFLLKRRGGVSGKLGNLKSNAGASGAGFDNVETTKRAIRFYDGQINTIFTRGTDERSLRPLSGKAETPIVLPEQFVNIVGVKSKKSKP